MTKQEYIYQVCSHCAHKVDDPYTNFWCSRADKYCSQVDFESDECFYLAKL